MTIFQTFYQITEQLPLSNGLLIVPDGDAPPGVDRVNMKNLYELFKQTNSHGLVSLPFLGLIQYYLEESDHSLIKNALTELYSNLSYIMLIGATDFRFEAVSDLIWKLEFLLKRATLRNKEKAEIDHIKNDQNINDGPLFVTKTEDPLDTVIEILDDPNVEHKKSMFP